MPFSLKAFNYQLNVLLFLVPGVYAIFQGRIVIGLFFLCVALLLEGTLLERFKKNPWAAYFYSISDYFSKSALISTLLVWVLWLGLSLTTLTFASFGCGFERPEWFPLSALVWLQIVFFLGLVAAARLNEPKKEKSRPEGSLWVSRTWFWAIFLFAVFMRAYKLTAPEGSYGFDEAAGIMETRLVHDMQNYRQGYYIAYYQKPLFCYIGLFLWHFLPNATGLFIVRISAILCDMGTVWLLYLTGKEVAGRRVGLYAMALGAISKPEMILSAMGMGAVLVPFCVLLPLLIALRLFKKTSLSHFLQLGLALSLGIYDNDYIRVVILFFIAILFVWLILKKENRVIKGPVGWIVCLNGAALAFYCYYMSFGFVQSSWINHLFQDRQMECFILMFMCFFFLALMTFALGPDSKEIKIHRNWINAFLGLWVCVFIDFPLMTRADALGRLDSMVNLNISVWTMLGNFIGKLGTALTLLFWSGTSPANMGNMGEAYYSFIEIVVIFLGLAFFLAKPTWPKAFVVLVAGVCILPHALAEGTHNVRVADTIGPFLVVGAWGVEELKQRTAGLSKSKLTGWIVCVLFALFYAWAAYTTYARVYYIWFDKQVLYFTGSRNVATHDAALGNRIYFCTDIFSVEATVVNEGVIIHKVYPVNMIYRGPNDTPQDITLVTHDFSSVEGKTLQLEVQKYFPKATWGREGEVEVCRIPYADLLDKKQKMFVLANEPANNWKREFSRNECGLLFDLIDYEDRAAHITDPIGPDYAKTYTETSNQWLEAVRYSTTIHVAKTGDYLLHYKATNRSYLKLDGRMIADLSFFQLLPTNVDQPPIYWAPTKEGDEKVHLEAGDHRVEVVTAFQRAFDPPGFWLRPKGEAAPGISLWNSFDF